MFRLLAAVAGLLWLWAAPGFAEQRIALVIGNGAYVANPALRNPVADAQLVSRTLGGAGFKVTELTNANQAQMKGAIADFGRALRAGGPDTVGLFYYAGHGVQSMGSNYLIPIGSRIRDEADLDLVGVEGRWVVRQMESARNVTNIVILDACRDNPFSGATGAGARGLARMEAPTGTFIAYATAPGDVAMDGAGANSPFTAALAAAMQEPGLPIEQAFKQVRVQVLRETGGRQTPWDSSSLVKNFAFRPAVAPARTEQQAWDGVRGSGDPVQLVVFLRSFPQSRHAEEARRLLQAAVSGRPAPPAAAAAPPPSPPAPVAAAPAAMAAGPGFAIPIGAGGPALASRSIQQLSEGTPAFSPIPGLDAATWQDKACGTCHSWTRAALCEQGQFYVRAGEARTVAKPHPYGGAFKAALRNWAGGGCK